MRLIKQDGQFVIHDKRNKNLLKELLDILNGRTIKLKEGAARTVLIMELMRELSRKLCFAQSFRANEGKEWTQTCLGKCLKVEVEAFLYYHLTKQVLEGLFLFHSQLAYHVLNLLVFNRCRFYII